MRDIDRIAFVRAVLCSNATCMCDPPMSGHCDAVAQLDTLSDRLLASSRLASAVRAWAMQDHGAVAEDLHAALLDYDRETRE